MIERQSTFDGGRATTWICLASFHATAIAWGVRQAYYDRDSLIDLIVPIALSVALAVWALTDASRRGIRFHRLVRLLFIFFAGIAVPGYVIWTHGWRGVGLVVLHATLWYALATISLIIAWYSLYGVAIWNS